jgi:uncharacterized protein (TIGR02246 family)
MYLRLMRFASCVILLLVGAIPVGGQSPADSASVTAFYREWFSSTADPSRYASFYAPDGLLLPPNSIPIRGRELIADWLRRSRANPPYTLRPEGIAVDEMRFLTPDWVSYRSTLRGQRVSADGGNASPFETKYVDLLHRNAAGKWEIVSRMWSDNR